MKIFSPAFKATLICRKTEQCKHILRSPFFPFKLSFCCYSSFPFCPTQIPSAGLPRNFSYFLLSSPTTAHPLLTSFRSPPKWKQLPKQRALTPTSAWQTLSLNSLAIPFLFSFISFFLGVGCIGGSGHGENFGLRGELDACRYKLSGRFLPASSQELVAVLVPGTINLDRFTTDKSTSPSS